MRLAFIDDFKPAVVTDRGVVDVSDVLDSIPRVDAQDILAGLITRFDEFRPKLEKAAREGKARPVDSVRFRPPAPKPANIACMAVNYMENGTRSEPAPINTFPKTPFAIIGPGDTMVLPDVPATIFEGEAELAVIIGKRATNVPQSEAMDYIFGYTNFIDGSARGLGGASVFHAMKSRDTFAPIGPYIVTSDEIKDPQNLSVRLWNNGDLMQDFNTNDMAHSIARCIEYVTSIHTLEPGDILATGTNHRGLHAFQDGDVVELECEGLGRLKFNVRDDLKRKWGRETRLQMQEQGKDGTTPQVSGKYAKSGVAG